MAFARAWQSMSRRPVPGVTFALSVPWRADGSAEMGLAVSAPTICPTALSGRGCSCQPNLTHENGSLIGNPVTHLIRRGRHRPVVDRVLCGAFTEVDSGAVGGRQASARSPCRPAALGRTGRCLVSDNDIVMRNSNLVRMARKCCCASRHRDTAGDCPTLTHRALSRRRSRPRRFAGVEGSGVPDLLAPAVSP